MVTLHAATGPRKVVISGYDPATFLTSTDQDYGVIACGALTADQAQTAYAQALTNPGQVWTVAGRQRTLAVVPILPGWQPCPA